MSPNARTKVRQDTSVLSRILPDPDPGKPRPAWFRPRVFIPVILVLAVGTAVGIVAMQRGTDIVEQEQTTTKSQLGTVSDPLAELCRTDPSVRARVGDAACGLAASVVANPDIPTTGVPGAAGENGRGIVSTTLVDGSLQIRYSDGSTETVGRVVGADGVPGATGRDGVGITGSQIADGRLVLSFSDGSTRDVGAVVGAAGAQGATGQAGADGRGITSVDEVEGRLRVTYSDGQTEDVGPLPTGPAGPAGADGSPATQLTLQGAGPLGSDLTCSKDEASPATAPVYVCQ